MELKRIIGSTRRNDLSVYADGRIELSAHVVRALSLGPGDVVDVASDGREYYLFVSLKAPTGRHTAQCREVNRGYRHFRFNSVKLARIMLLASGHSDVAHFPVGGATTIMGGYKALTIITHISQTTHEGN